MERISGGSGRFFLKLLFIFIWGNLIFFIFAENAEVEFFIFALMAAPRAFMDSLAERSLAFALEKASFIACLILLRSFGIVGSVMNSALESY